MAKKYIVAQGNAFTSGGHVYKAGEVIPEGLFSDKTYFAKLLSGRKIVEQGAEATEVTTDSAKKEKKKAKSESAESEKTE